MTNKLFFDKIKHKIELEIFVSQFLSYKTKHANLLCEVQKKTENLNSKISKTKNGEIIIHSKCAVCVIKKSRFVKEQDAKGLLSNLGLKTPPIKISLLDDILF